MKAIVCEMCSSNDFVKEDGYYVCQHCGTKYTVEEAKKMMIEGTVDVQGTVKIDKSDDIKNWLEVARRARESNDSETAAKYYDMVMAKDPNSWEAAFYSLYFSSINIQNKEINHMSHRIRDSINGIGQLVFKIENFEERKAAICDLIPSITRVATALKTAYESYFKSLPRMVNDPYEKMDTDQTCCDILIRWGDLLYEHRAEDSFYLNSAITTYKNAMEILPGEVRVEVLYYDSPYHKEDQFSQQIQAKIDYFRVRSKRIKEVEPEYYKVTPKAGNKKSGGCYVATCVYGSYDCPQVWTLRRYRDFTLAETWYGRLFIRSYYAISPTIVKRFGGAKWFKNMWQGRLDRMVKRLNESGVENTPYKDKKW